MVQRIGRLAPYLWPTKSAPLQLLAGLCIILLILGRAVNVLLPLSLGELVRTFEDKSGRSPWFYLFGYVGLRFLQSGGGIAALRDSLWAPVMQYSDREMSQLSFDHLLNLSFAFHMRRKTGEILRILDRGSAVNRTFELILFNIIPTFFDIIIALVVFCVMFDWTLSAVIFVVMFAYVAASVVLTRYRTKLRREMNDRDVVTRGIHTDCLLNYETVKYFGGEQHEGERYRDAIRQYQSLEYKVMVSLNLLNLVQNFIITLGLLVGSMIVALRVTRGQSSTSDFVIFITYLSQLYGPLNNLGFVYRSVNQSLVDTERLLKLLNEPSDVNDSPDAPDLIVDNGEVEFENVSFSYDGRTTALNGVSFKVPKGSSVALVGESGAGKSTVLRLLYRFYDLKPGEGRILIDGQDIRDVTQGSLRKAIGVVPQDSVLFNSSIGYNIGYGKFGALQDEIEIAAQAAQMHERILSFPDGYDTKVGERGVRLSGGEKQRVAIARTLLKNPPILLLDEATSALDTSTEKDIQKALQNLQRGRSSLSIAHRLSTIASADIILVLKDGQIAEQGSHKELLALDGIFASMWADQISSSEDPVFITQPDKDVADGYDVGQIEAERQAAETETQPAAQNEGAEQSTIVDSPQVISVPLENVDDVPAVESEGVPAPEEPPVVPLKDTEATISFPSSDAPTAFPSTEPEVSASPAPLAFPISNDSGSQQAHSERAPSQPHAPGVTFGASVGSPPSRTGTPDPEGEPKRRRIGSQNFQRLARRISVTARSGTVSNIPFLPGLKRDASTVSASSAAKDEGAESSARNSNDSPAGSISSDPQAGKKKKEKKDKKRMSFI
ncbi:hypothetical protein SERLA73DRAFT_88045 [Serpula lacrymans var. lacrymans S7.3]|uniref:Uncharacterized protein n=2 Tax=Serpula lacrymans var. lacrymans TaxID=341189 RepID=F8PVW6_SERL3|nr:uncharacterized protein SERLADRAFT_355557 [Serpula lacrymans var. lacrymans S7.9]EGN99562.1 hypothetical protein SERLA73DRAFT_88045 [Serpula lacrymans var. lacrymans S7.3]EGO25132.1 hypothetical protein SERLADRAFT_355557 [Serpula lacrymans var. lacrymans S7.9]